MSGTGASVAHWLLSCSKQEKKQRRGTPLPPLPPHLPPRDRRAPSQETAGTVPRNGSYRSLTQYIFNTGRLLVLLELHSGIAGLRLQPVGGRSRVVFPQPSDWRFRVGMFPSRVLFGLHLWYLLLNVVVYEFMRFIGASCCRLRAQPLFPLPLCPSFRFPLSTTLAQPELKFTTMLWTSPETASSQGGSVETSLKTTPRVEHLTAFGVMVVRSSKGETGERVMASWRIDHDPRRWRVRHSVWHHGLFGASHM